MTGLEDVWAPGGRWDTMDRCETCGQEHCYTGSECSWEPFVVDRRSSVWVDSAGRIFDDGIEPMMFVASVIFGKN